MLGTRFWVQGQCSQCCLLGSGFRDWVLSAGYQVLGSGTGFSLLGNRFWVQGLGSQCWVIVSGFRDLVLSAHRVSFKGGGEAFAPPLKMFCPPLGNSMFQF